MFLAWKTLLNGFKMLNFNRYFKKSFVQNIVYDLVFIYMLNYTIRRGSKKSFIKLVKVESFSLKLGYFVFTVFYKIVLKIAFRIFFEDLWNWIKNGYISMLCLTDSCLSNEFIYFILICFYLFFKIKVIN